MADNKPQGLRDDELSAEELEQAAGGAMDANGSQCFCSNTTCPPQDNQEFQ